MQAAPNILSNLSATSLDLIEEEAKTYLSKNEKILFAFSSSKDFVIFTDVHIVISSALGVTNLKRAITTLSYKHIAAFTVELAGSFDLDTKLILHFDLHLSPVELRLQRGTEIDELAHFLADICS